MESWGKAEKKSAPVKQTIDIAANCLAGIAMIWAFAVLPPVSVARADNTHPTRLKVGMVEAPPFAMKIAGDTWRGLSIDIWQAVASKLAVKYDLQEFDSFEQMVAAVVGGSLDVAIGLAATEQRESVLDFSHPYYRSGLAIAVPKDRIGQGWYSIAGRVQIGRLFGAIGLLFLFWLISGAAVLAFEHRRNREMFGGGPIKALGQAVWWAAVTMTTVGYGDKAPQTLGGRVVAVAWMLISIGLITGFTAVMSASLTAETLHGKVRGLQDLPYVRVGTLAQSETVDWMVDNWISPQTFSSVSEGLKALVDDWIDAFVFDEIVLKYTVKNNFSGRVHVMAEIFDPYLLCLGLPHSSPMREPINRTLLKLMETGQWKRLKEVYVGAGD